MPRRCDEECRRLLHQALNPKPIWTHDASHPTTACSPWPAPGTACLRSPLPTGRPPCTRRIPARPDGRRNRGVRPGPPRTRQPTPLRVLMVTVAGRGIVASVATTGQASDFAGVVYLTRLWASGSGSRAYSRRARGCWGGCFPVAVGGAVLVVSAELIGVRRVVVSYDDRFLLHAARPLPASFRSETASCDWSRSNLNVSRLPIPG